MNPRIAWLTALALLTVIVSTAAASELPVRASYSGKRLQPAYLRCESKVNPLGIDEITPRLSWTVESSERGQRQTAYRVLAASSADLLACDSGDLWDSSQVLSADTTAIVYAGKPLVSGQPCFWKVKVWDANGKASPWSAAAKWTMGLLQPSDWQAEWIGCDALRHIELPEAQFGDAKWIWFANDAQPQVPTGKRAFYGKINLPSLDELTGAELLIAANDTFYFTLNGQHIAMKESGDKTPLRAYRRDVRQFLQVGKNIIRVVADHPAVGPAGVIVNLTLTTKSGKKISGVTDATWQASDNPDASTTNANAWTACRVLGEHGITPWGKLKAAGNITPPATYLRREFSVNKPVVRATLYATALGWFDLQLNGRRISDDYFIPGWTDYTKRIYYRTYDVTAYLRRGPNAVGAILADGWYSGYIGWNGGREHYGNQPRLLAQVILEFADGSREVVATNPKWKASNGPILGADILKGETYDATKELVGWDKPGFNDRLWSSVDTGTVLQPVVQAHPGPPVVAIKEFQAKSITEPKPGVFVFNLGQNFAGVPRLKLRGEPGQRITLWHGERLNPDGTVYTINLRGADATDVYICKGGGEETWSPRFTFHGFQYIEVTGLKRKPTKETVKGVALSSDTPVAGDFECSDPMLNQLHHNIYWTQRANFIDIPTDCPQRDERLGWTGDAQTYVRTATLNTDVQAFFTKWLVDLNDAQRPDGQFPQFAPVRLRGISGADGGSAWADAGVICPWTVYEVYGDKRELSRHYAAMCRYIAYCEQRSTLELLPPEKFHTYGDWLSINANTPKDVLYTAYFAYSTKLVAQAAEALGKPEDAAKYQGLFARIKAAFNKAYVSDDGRVKGDTQTGYVLALAFDLLEAESAQRAAGHLVDGIEKRGWHLSTGFVGTKDLMLVLAKIGRNDVAYRLIHNDTFPSWGFSLKHGATTIWERWDSWTPERGFDASGMNSFAHYSFGAVYQWMVENIGGIRNGGDAYARIAIAPTPDDKLTFARLTYDSIHGPIRTEWKKTGSRLIVNVDLPANTTAAVSLPAKSADEITEGGESLAKTSGVKFLRMDGDRVVLAVESGNYHFTIGNRKQHD